jgi:hypothetical protein
MFQQSINEARARQRRQDYMREAADERMLRSAHSDEATEAEMIAPAETATPARGFLRGLFAGRRRRAVHAGDPGV